MTNRTDLDKCCAQIELISGLINQPETFDLNEVLVALQTKKKLLMAFKPRDYTTILKGIESGELIHPGEWIEEKKEVIPEPEPIPIVDLEREKLEKELQITKEKLMVLEEAITKKGE